MEKPKRPKDTNKLAKKIADIATGSDTTKRLGKEKTVKTNKDKT